MNLSELPAYLEQNKAAAAGVGAVAVVGVVLIRKRKAASAGTATDAGAALSAGSQTAAASGGAAYDSTASDLYGAIQPQLEALGNQLTALQNPTTIPTTAAPAPAPATKVTVPGPRPAPSTIPRATPRGVTPLPKVTGAPKTLTYTVKPGDNLTKIAAQYPTKSITSKTIYAANRATIGSNASLIKPGQKLVIK